MAVPRFSCFFTRSIHFISISIFFISSWHTLSLRDTRLSVISIFRQILSKILKCSANLGKDFTFSGPEQKRMKMRSSVKVRLMWYCVSLFFINYCPKFPDKYDIILCFMFAPKFLLGKIYVLLYRYLSYRILICRPDAGSQTGQPRLPAVGFSPRSGGRPPRWYPRSQRHLARAVVPAR